MIHEGDHTDSGHYYDLVKNPYTGKWFKYNDEVGHGFSEILYHSPHLNNFIKQLEIEGIMIKIP